MSNKPAKFVTTICACGNSFEREVKRGRPQKWCPSCADVPFYNRVVVSVPVSNDAEPGSDSQAQERPARPNDALGHVRDEIEAAMAVANAEHKERYASLVANGVDKHVAAEQSNEILKQETLDIYAKYR